MKSDPASMTNRELHTELLHSARFDIRLQLATEMARRLNRKNEFLWMPSEKSILEIETEFRHWKLNGAQDQRW